MEILTGEIMRRVDARAIGEHRIPSLDLMESAGRGVAEALAEEVPNLVSRRVVVFCGKGNNGGDGLVAARHLRRMGVSVRVLLLARGDALAGDAAANLARAREAGLAVEELGDEGEWSRTLLDLDRDTIVVDALLGTGVTGGARGTIARAVDAIWRWFERHTTRLPIRHGPNPGALVGTRCDHELFVVTECDRCYCPGWQ